MRVEISVKTLLFPNLSERLVITAAIMTKAEIVTDHQTANTQAVN